ncbi:MAG: hypothetical protein RLZZ312_1584 [Bacteroidota bacterium]|jgi:hypothetical protein
MNTNKKSKQNNDFRAEDNNILKLQKNNSSYLFDEKYQEIEVFFSKLNENFPVIYANIRV